MHEAFPANHHFAGSPIDVIDFESDDLTGTQSKAGKENQDRIVAPPCRCPAIAGIQQALDLLLGQELGDGRQAPIRNGRHTSSQIDLDLRLAQQESKE
jgi:hypothetical protein